MEVKLTARVNNIRKRTLDLIYHAQAPHSACALSCVEILAALYEVIDKNKFKNQELDRDRIILSKGHAIAAQLAALCEYGFFEKDQVYEYCKYQSLFPENTSSYTPYIDIATGSLGQGISFGVGVALGMKLRHYDNCCVYVIVGDGELNEGQNWEGIQQASYFNLDNLIVIVDANGLAGIQETRIKGNFEEKFNAFHFNTTVIEGNNIDDLLHSIRFSSDNKSSKSPKALICNTTKGNGISFMENNNDWHYRPISKSDYQKLQSEMRHAL